MKYTYHKISTAQMQTILAALKHWQNTTYCLSGRVPTDLRVLFKDHNMLDIHETDSLIDQLNSPVEVNSEVDLEATQSLPTKTERRSHRAYLHVQSLYGEAALSDVLENVRSGAAIVLRHDDLRALAFGAAALELMKSSQATSSKLTLERMMTTIYDHTECTLTRMHIQALEDAEAALRAITEKYSKPHMERRHSRDEQT